MGGYGSGWHGGCGRPRRKWRVDECPLWIDAYELRRMGVFAHQREAGVIRFDHGDHGDGDHVDGDGHDRGDYADGDRVVRYSFDQTGPRPTLRLNFRWAGADRREFIELESLPDNLGGRRLYFLCPECERRAARLYVPPDEDRFFCRACGRLTYLSVQTHDPRVSKMRHNPDLAAMILKLAAAGVPVPPGQIGLAAQALGLNG